MTKGTRIGLGMLTWALLLAAAALLAGQAGLLAGRPPADLGVRDGRLKPPSDTDNSVSSQSRLWPGHPRRDAAWIAPLALAGDGPATMARLQALLAGWPGATVVVARSDYLQVAFRTPWLGFVDDAEFWLDPAAGVVQVRSASRLGRSDWGVNRRRIEALRTRLAATTASGGEGACGRVAAVVSPYSAAGALV